MPEINNRYCKLTYINKSIGISNAWCINYVGMLKRSQQDRVQMHVNETYVTIDIVIISIEF